MIAIDLSKHQVPETDPKAMQQTNFNKNLDQQGNTRFFIVEDAKQTILAFSQGTVKAL